MNADANVVSLNPAAAAADADIDAMDVSERWKQYFKTVRRYGGLQAPLAKSLPKEQRLAASKELMPPFASTVLAFVFGFFYYLAKGMWKKGLVLLAITIAALIVVGSLLYMIGGETLADATRFLGGAIFAGMAPRDFYAFKVERDDGWMPVRPF
ncbi:DUF2628 domain-containing protein [Dokdonella sp.]|uniref:DUF2628 domain-containing protein n=1 Tax=Dokdonella sp. TaxID=2291710 RepID=UPI0026261727|nr:DUF2628 domain-containing protein [Dokdonella sp.]